MKGACILGGSLLPWLVLQDVFEETLLYQGVAYPGQQALKLPQLEQFIARVHASDASYFRQP